MSLLFALITCYYIGPDTLPFCVSGPSASAADDLRTVISVMEKPVDGRVVGYHTRRWGSGKLVNVDGLDCEPKGPGSVGGVWKVRDSS
jgi:hypothetical protein